MKSFNQFLETKGWFAEGRPGTKENPPDNTAWASQEPITNAPPGILQGNQALSIPKNGKKERLHKKELKRLPKWVQEEPDVKKSTERGPDRTW